MTDRLDILHGAQAIADFLGLTPRQVYHLSQSNALPTFKLGQTTCARRSTLVEWIEAQERGAA